MQGLPREGNPCRSPRNGWIGFCHPFWIHQVGILPSGSYFVKQVIHSHEVHPIMLRLFNHRIRESRFTENIIRAIDRFGMNFCRIHKVPVCMDIKELVAILAFAEDGRFMSLVQRKNIDIALLPSPGIASPPTAD